MSAFEDSFTTNTLLKSLSPDNLSLITPHLSRVTLSTRQALVDANKPIEHIYFPENGVVSVVADMPESGTTEVGIFGRDGVTATCLLLGSDRTPHQSYMQVDGTSAMRIDVAPYLAAVDASIGLRMSLMRYVHTFLVQVAQSAAANAHHRIEARLARWLLMCHDRLDGDEIALTHEFMGMMIAAERSGVTVTLHILEGAGLIRSKRGRVIILEREKLEELAGDSYGIPEAEYRRLVGPIGRTSNVAPIGAQRARVD